MREPDRTARADHEVANAQRLSPQSRALYEAGKALLVESINTGREFCKQLMGLAIGAIPVYVALVRLFLPEKYRPGLGDGALLLAPAFLFLVAAVVAALGFMPKSASLSLEIVDEIRQERDRLIRWRRRFGIFAFILFLLAVVVAILVSALAILHIVGR